MCEFASAVNTASSPVMLAKEASIYLAIFVSQCFSRPERKTFQLSPHQWMGLRLHTTKQAIVSDHAFSIKLPITSSSRTLNVVGICAKRYQSLIYSHMVHKTSCLSFDKRTGSTPDKLQFHSSGDGNQTRSLTASIVIFPKQLHFK